MPDDKNKFLPDNPYDRLLKGGLSLSSGFHFSANNDLRDKSPNLTLYKDSRINTNIDPEAPQSFIVPTNNSFFEKRLEQTKKSFDDFKNQSSALLNPYDISMPKSMTAPDLGLPKTTLDDAKDLLKKDEIAAKKQTENILSIPGVDNGALKSNELSPLDPNKSNPFLKVDPPYRDPMGYENVPSLDFGMNPDMLPEQKEKEPEPTCEEQLNSDLNSGITTYGKNKTIIQGQGNSEAIKTKPEEENDEDIVKNIQNAFNNATGSVDGEGESGDEDLYDTSAADKYFKIAKAIDGASLLRNIVQPPPPSVQLPQTHLKRQRFDRTPYDNTREQIKQQSVNANRAMREGMSQASDLMKGNAAVSNQTQVQLSNLGAQENAAEAQIDAANVQIANQEQQIIDQQNQQEIMTNYQIQAAGQQAKDQAISNSIDNIKKDFQAEAQYKTQMSAMRMQDKLDKDYQDRMIKIQAATAGFEAYKDGTARANAISSAFSKEQSEAIKAYAKKYGQSYDEAISDISNLGDAQKGGQVSIKGTIDAMASLDNENKEYLERIGLAKEDLLKMNQDDESVKLYSEGNENWQESFTNRSSELQSKDYDKEYFGDEASEENTKEYDDFSRQKYDEGIQAQDALSKLYSSVVGGSEKEEDQLVDPGNLDLPTEMENFESSIMDNEEYPMTDEEKEEAAATKEENYQKYSSNKINSESTKSEFLAKKDEERKSKINEINETQKKIEEIDARLKKNPEDEEYESKKKELNNQLNVYRAGLRSINARKKKWEETWNPQEARSRITEEFDKNNPFSTPDKYIEYIMGVAK